MRRLWMLSLVVGTLVAFGTTAVSAQDATPAAATDRSMYIVPGAECVINTLLPADLNALATMGTPAAAAAPSPVADVAAPPFAVLGGTPADAETDAAVRAVLRQSIACYNAGNFARYFSLLTPEELTSSYTADAVAAILNSPPMPFPVEAQRALYGILGVTILEDGRAGAYVLLDGADNPAPVEVYYAIAAETDKGWKIDDFYAFDESGAVVQD